MKVNDENNVKANGKGLAFIGFFVVGLLVLGWLLVVSVLKKPLSEEQLNRFAEGQCGDVFRPALITHVTSEKGVKVCCVDLETKERACNFFSWGVVELLTEREKQREEELKNKLKK